MILESSNVVFFCLGVAQTINCECAKLFCFLFRVFLLSFAPGLTLDKLRPPHRGDMLVIEAVPLPFFERPGRKIDQQ